MNHHRRHRGSLTDELIPDDHTGDASKRGINHQWRRSGHLRGKPLSRTRRTQGGTHSASSTTKPGIETATTATQETSDSPSSTVTATKDKSTTFRTSSSSQRHKTKEGPTRLQRTFSNCSTDLTVAPDKQYLGGKLHRKGSRTTKNARMSRQRKFFEDTAHSDTSIPSLSPTGSCSSGFFDTHFAAEFVDDERQSKDGNDDSVVTSEYQSGSSRKAQEHQIDYYSEPPNIDDKIPKLDYTQFDNGETFSEYTLGGTIGSGGFGHVRLARHMYSGEICAIKFLHKGALQSAGDVERIITEIQCMHQLQHPHIIKLHSIVDESSFVALIMEYASGGDLKHFVEEQPKGHLEPEVALLVFGQILKGVIYAHENHITHRDLKLQNVLLSSKGTCKLSDFGLSSFYQPGDRSKSTAGSLLYMAPELIAGCTSEGPPLDVWSLGVLLYALLVGQTPFEHAIANASYKAGLVNKNTPDNYRKAVPRSMKEVTNRVRAAILSHDFSIPESVPEEVVGLIRALMDPVPMNRPSIARLKTWRWIFDSPHGLVVKSLEDLWLLPWTIHRNFMKKKNGELRNTVLDRLRRTLRRYWEDGADYESASSESDGDGDLTNVDTNHADDKEKHSPNSAQQSHTSSVNIIPGPLKSSQTTHQGGLPPLHNEIEEGQAAKMNLKLKGAPHQNCIGSQPLDKQTSADVSFHGRLHAIGKEEKSIANLRKQAREESSTFAVKADIPSSSLGNLEEYRAASTTKSTAGRRCLPPLNDSGGSTPSSRGMPTPQISMLSRHNQFFPSPSDSTDSVCENCRNFDGAAVATTVKLPSSPLGSNISKDATKNGVSRNCHQDPHDNGENELHKMKRPSARRRLSLPSPNFRRLTQKNGPEDCQKDENDNERGKLSNIRRPLEGRRFSLPSPSSFRTTYLTHRRTSIS